jgi:hypothetical protein
MIQICPLLALWSYSTFYIREKQVEMQKDYSSGSFRASSTKARHSTDQCYEHAARLLLRLRKLVICNLTSQSLSRVPTAASAMPWLQVCVLSRNRFKRLPFVLALTVDIFKSML